MAAPRDADEAAAVLEVCRAWSWTSHLAEVLAEVSAKGEGG